MNRSIELLVAGLALLAAATAGGTPAGSWWFSDGPEFPGAKGALEEMGDGTVRLCYDFTGGGNYVAAYLRLEQPVALGELQFALRKAAEVQVTVRATGSDGQTFQKRCYYGHDGWQALACGMDGWEAHWGGPNDGLFRQPVTEVGVLVDNTALLESTGHVDIREVRLMPGASAVEGAPVPAGTVTSTYLVTDFSPLDGFRPSGSAPMSWYEDRAWRVDFERGDTAAWSGSMGLLGSPKSLRLTIEGGTPGNEVYLRLGSHFQTFGRDVGVLEGGRTTLEVPVPPEGWDYWGGENDGRVHPPLRIVELGIRRGSGPAGAVVFPRVSLACETEVSRAKPVVLELDGPDALAVNLSGAPLEGTYVMRADAPPAPVATLAEGPWRLEPGVNRRSAPALADADFVEYQASFHADGREVAAAVSSRVAPPEPRAVSDACVPESPWGMGLYLYRYPPASSGSDLMAETARLGAAAGVKWSREEFSWARIEPRRGDFDFTFYDEVVDTALARGIRVYGLLSYWSEWTEAYTEAGIDDFCTYAAATVAHFKDRVKHWEVYNEPNIFFWSGPRELYPVLLERCYAAIKAADPEAQVLGCSTAGVDLGFIRQCVEAGAPFDILTVHPYRSRLTEASFIADLQRAKDVAGGRPVWITEMGWNTATNGVSEREQAGLLARCYLAAALSGACDNISWYDFRNDGEDPRYNEHNFGVVRRDGSPKPAYRALATLTAKLGHHGLRPGPVSGQGLYSLASDRATALWSPTPWRGLRLPVAPGGTPRVTGLMGVPASFTYEDGALVLDLPAGEPVYIEGVTLTPSAAGETPAPPVIRF